MYARIKPSVVLNKTLSKLEVVLISYSLGSFRPTLGFKIICSDESILSQGNITLSPEVYTKWTINDEILIEFAAKELGLELLDIIKPNEKTSSDFIKENPNLETKTNSY